MTIEVFNHMGDSFIVYRKKELTREAISSIRSVYVDTDYKRMRSKPCDMFLNQGGLATILADGTLVCGFNTFTKADYKKIYNYLSEKAILK